MASGKKNERTKTNAKLRELTAEEVIKLADVKLQWARAAQIFAVFVGLSIFALAATPLARAIAGTRTDFNLTTSLSVSIAMGSAALLGGGGFAVQTARVRHHKKRSKELENKALELHERLAKAKSGNKIPAQGAVE